MLPAAFVRAARLASRPPKNARPRPVPYLTQEELAVRLHTWQCIISAIELGKREPDPGFIAKVLVACGLPPGWTPCG